MKLKTLWASALAILALATACSKDAEVSTEVLPSEGKTKQIGVNLIVGQNEEGLRSVFGVKNDGSGAITGLEMSDKDVLVRVSVKQGVDQYVVQDLVFKKQAGRNYATYSGKITVPASGTSSSYKISAALVEEVGGVKFLEKFKDFTTPTLNPASVDLRLEMLQNHTHISQKNAEGKVEVNVPYVTKWQDITAVATGGDAANSLTLKFEPQGTILRMRIKNESASAQPFGRIKFVTNAFVQHVSYYLDQELDNGPKYYPGNSEELPYHLPSAITLDSKAFSDWYYVWVMPRKSYVKQLSVVSLGQLQGTAWRYARVFTTEQPLPMGSVPLTLRYLDGHDGTFANPVERGEEQEWGTAVAAPVPVISRFATHVLNKTADGFVDNYLTNNENVGWFTDEDLTTGLLKNPITIGGVKYGLPTKEEFAALFPTSVDPSGLGSLRYSSFDVEEPNITLGSTTSSFSADYGYRQGSKNLYAIRFKDASNRNRTAFRYSALQEGTNLSLKVETLYIGAEALSLEDVKNDALWTARASEVHSIVFPMYGSYIPSFREGKYEINAGLQLATATPFDATARYYAILSATTIRPAVALSSRARHSPILLIKR